MKFIDLFCGIGGFHQALSNLGHECVFASDIDQDCRKVYTENYGLEPHGDIEEVDIEEIPSFDILCAGFPCQPFSKAGNQRGFDDRRGNLFYNICDIVEKHKPKYLILENVRNLASHDGGNTWNTIKREIDRLGYQTYDNPLILNTLYFGIPQSRERVVILCKRKDLGDLPKLPVINKDLIQETSLYDIVEEKEAGKPVDKKMKVVEEVWNNFLLILKDNNIEVPRFPLWTDWWDSDGEGTQVCKRDPKKSDEENDRIIAGRQSDFYNKYTNWIDKNREFYHTHSAVLDSWLEESRDKKEWLGAVRKFEWQVSLRDSSSKRVSMNEVLWSPRGSGVRVKYIDYSPTLVAMTSMIPIFGPYSRQFTPRECARLQSFPDEFILPKDDKVAYKQFGNAVNVKMIERCADFLIHDAELFEEDYFYV